MTESQWLEGICLDYHQLCVHAFSLPTCPSPYKLRRAKASVSPNSQSYRSDDGVTSCSQLHLHEFTTLLQALPFTNSTIEAAVASMAADPSSEFSTASKGRFKSDSSCKSFKPC